MQQQVRRRVEGRNGTDHAVRYALCKAEQPLTLNCRIERDNIQKSLQAQVTARLKIMAGLDIAEKRLPQDGRIKMTIGGSDIDLRVSSCPAYHGESTVLRILRPESAKMQ